MSNKQEFDCFYTAFSKQTPCIKLEELPHDFPCEEIYWGAPTAYAWAADPNQELPRGQPTIPTVRTLLSPQPDYAVTLKHFDHLSKRLLCRCLGRCLESIQEQMESSVYNILWEDPSDHAVTVATRARISAAIMSVYQSSWEEILHGSSLRIILRIAIAAHYSHIFAAGRLTGMIVTIARKQAGESELRQMSGVAHPASVAANSGRSTPHDTEFFKKTFWEIPKDVRELMWHASQVIYLQHRHPFNTPHEPLSVFIAGLSLWAFLKYFDAEGDEPIAEGGVQLDEPSFCSSPEVRQGIQCWIEEGGQAYLEGVGDVGSPEAPKRILSLCLNMTKRLRVWRTASKVSDIFARLLQREEQEFNESNALRIEISSISP
jgi:hypothetical protein